MNIELIILVSLCLVGGFLLLIVPNTWRSGVLYILLGIIAMTCIEILRVVMQWWVSMADRYAYLIATVTFLTVLSLFTSSSVATKEVRYIEHTPLE